MSHTKGSWIVTDIGEGREVAAYNEDYGLSQVASLEYSSLPEKEVQANCGLIAAAPDLLHVLKTILEVWDEHKIVGPTVYQDAQAIIAIAEGGI